MSGAVRLFRVDPRLVHATLMNAWVPAIGAEMIIIADRTATEDPRLRMILEMSAMDLVKLSFTTEEELSVSLARVPFTSPAIVVFASLEGAERAVASGVRIEHLNVGHLPESPDRTAIHPAVHLGPSDLASISRLESRGVEVFVQPLPRDQRLAPSSQPITALRASQIPHTPRIEGAPRVPRPSKSDSSAGSKRVEAQLRVVNERGLHLRAAHTLAHLAGSMAEEVRVGHEGEFVNAKSLLGLTTLGASCGAIVDVIVTGADPEPSMDAIRKLFASGFDEGVDQP